MKPKALGLVATLFALLPFAAVAQDYSLGSRVISGGGGTSSGGDYTINGTIGQPAADFSSGGNYRLWSGFWRGGLTVVVEPDESFEAWMENLAAEDKPPQGQRGPGDSPAGDGVPNLLKYALGLMPMTPSADAAPRIVLHEGFLIIELERSRTAAVAFEVEASTDLSAWSAIPFNEQLLDENIGNNRERVLLLTDLETEAQTKYFLRLRILMP